MVVPFLVPMRYPGSWDVHRPYVCVSLPTHHAESHSNRGALKTPLSIVVIAGAQHLEGPAPLQDRLYPFHNTNGRGVGERGGQQDVIPEPA